MSSISQNTEEEEYQLGSMKQMPCQKNEATINNTFEISVFIHVIRLAVIIDIRRHPSNLAVFALSNMLDVFDP